MGEGPPAPSQPDTGDRPYYATQGVQCTEALRACLGREGYICWLRGTIIKYMWRTGAKPDVDPAEEAVKVGWYSRELERVLRDPAA